MISWILNCLKAQKLNLTWRKPHLFWFDGWISNQQNRQKLFKAIFEAIFFQKKPLRQVKTKEGCCVDLLAKNFQFSYQIEKSPC